MIERWIRFSMDNRLVTAILALLVMAIGLDSYRRLPVDAFPDVSPNLVQVFIVTEGLAPEEIEKYVTYPVEAAMTGLPGVERVRSVSNFGLSVVSIYFRDGMDVYFARQLVGERLGEAKEEIPEGFGEPRMGPISTGMGLILFYYLEDTTGEYSLTELRSIQDWVIKFHLQTVPGVTEVLGIGGFEKQYHVVVHPEELLRYDVTLAEVIDRIHDNSLNVGAQFVEKNAEEFLVRSVGLATTIDDLRSIVVRASDGRPIYLRDVADVREGGAIRRGLQTRNGAGEVVAGMVIKLFGANSSLVIQRVEEKLAAINGILPPGVRVVPYYEQKSLVEAAVSTVKSALLQGIVLVALVLFLFMGGLRASAVVAVSIPFSVLFAFALMRRFGITANLMSLGGLAIAIGMMVDGAVVIVESMDRALRPGREGRDRAETIRAAASDVARPVAFAILIIIVVFLPLFTLQGVEGKTFRPLAQTVVLGMLGSMIFALLLAPMLGNLIMRRPRHRSGAPKEPLLIRGVLAVYRPAIQRLVGREGLAAGLAVLLLAGGAVVVPTLGSEFTPRLNEGTIIVGLTFAPSISLGESKRMTMIVERRLVGVPEVREVVSRVGRGEVGAHTHPVNSVEVLLLLKERGEWRRGLDQAGLEEKIRERVAGMPGVMVNIGQPIALNVDHLLEGVRAELAVKLFGEDLALLEAKADEIAGVLRAVDGAADVQVDQVSGAPQLLVRVDREAIARYGINVRDVQELIHAAVGGRPAGEIFEGVRRFDIVVRFEEEARDTKEAIGRILVTSPEGAKVPLRELAFIDEVVGPRQITREDNQRFVTIQCNVTGRDIGGFVDEAEERIEAAIDLPPGYLVTWGGQFRLQQEANRRLALVIPVTLFLVFLLLYGNFRSLRSSVLILLNIPLALAGGVWALALTGQNLSVPASVGFIALFGIALENGMVLVTHMNRLAAAGRTAIGAAVEGATDRVRPVLMTALTTALGLVPLLLSHGTGSEVQRPLATVVVGGLFTSTLVTLLIVPCLYRRFGDTGHGDER